MRREPCDLTAVAARAADAAGNPGPLGGLPLGAKDLAATRDWPTACGSPIYAGVSMPFDAAVLALTRRAGGVIAGKTVTTEFAEAMTAQRQIMAWEAARALAFEAEVHWPQLSAGLQAQIAEGRVLDWPTVAAAHRWRDATIAAFPEILRTHGVAALVTPSAAGVAPSFADGTGSPDFNRLWTLLRAPCVQVPGLICAETSLPLGVQVVAPQGADALALAVASRLEAAME